MEDNLETTNINLEWLNNICNQLKVIQNIERVAREGCRNLMEYMQIPFNIQRISMADAQYKNLRFFALELDILITNLAPVINENVDKYKTQFKSISKNINNRSLFVEERHVNNKLVEIYTLPFFNTTLDYLILIKAEIIKDIGHILYLPTEEKGKKKW